MTQDNLQLSNKAMEYVVALAEHRTISAAAESVFISQPAMSHFIHSLEQRLGFKLFNRVGNQYVPTYEGERYLYHARRIILAETQMYSEFAEIKKEGRGQIRFVLPTLRSEYILPHLIATYHRQHPNVELIVREVHSRFLERVLLNGEVDFAVMNAPIKSPDISSQLILHDEVLLAIPADHPCALMGQLSKDGRFPRIDISLFAHDEFVLQNPDQRTRQTANSLFKSAGFSPRILAETHSIEAALGIVGNGAGICFAPETYIYQSRFFRQLRFFSLGDPSAVYDISIAYLKKSYHPKYYENFISAVREAILQDRIP